MLEIKLLEQHKELWNRLEWLQIVRQLKGESGVETHFLQAVLLTNSGVDVLQW